MYEHAIIIATDNNGKVTVSCDTGACTSCKGSAFCKAKGKTFPAKLTEQVQVSIGDTVELYLPPGKTVASSFIALLLPILLFPIGYYIPSLFSSTVTETIRIIAGFIGIAIGFGFARIFTKLRGDQFIPTVVRVIEE